MNHAKINDLDRVVLHHENIAGFDVAMDEVLIVRSLQTRGKLAKSCQRYDRQSERSPDVLNNFFQSPPGQQGHNKIRATLAVKNPIAGVEDVDNIGVTEARKDSPLAFKQLNGFGTGVGPDRLESDKPFGYNIIGFVDDTHPTFAQRSFGDFIATVDRKRLREGGCHSCGDSL